MRRNTHQDRGNLVEVEEAIIGKQDLNEFVDSLQDSSAAPYSIEINNNRGKVILFATKVIHFLAEWQLMLYILAGLNLSVTAKSGWWIPLMLDGLFTAGTSFGVIKKKITNQNTIGIHWLFFLMHNIQNCTPRQPKIILHKIR